MREIYLLLIAGNLKSRFTEVNNTARVDVRNIPEDVALRLSEKAKRLGVSREAYARDILIMAANADIVEEVGGYN